MQTGADPVLSLVRNRCAPGKSSSKRGKNMAERETELLRNGSGYVDPTAYKALKKIEKNENGGGKKYE